MAAGPKITCIDNRLYSYISAMFEAAPIHADSKAALYAGLAAQARAARVRAVATGDVLYHAPEARLLQDVQDLAERGDRWHGISAGHVWSLWTRFACTAFYSHPWAWNEIGFPGLAYPRGYLNPGINARENFETGDHRPADPVPFAVRVERARRLDDDLPDRSSDE